MQPEWKQIGVNVTLVPTENLIGDFYSHHDAPIGISPGVKAGLGALEGPFTPGGGIGNVRNYSNSYLSGIVSQLAQVAPTSPQAVALWNQAQNFVVKNALSIWIAFQLDVFAASKTLKGVQFLVDAFPVPVIYFWTLSTDRG